ncbi:DUF2332 domain-containing protein [Catenuloplanes sp. NPDC051500]|uniref:DUF2332 domain-containing protein n=1 Tax=Catenuloplanes sp. NPDC051500 TaxID=3363959 RepID=UPI00378A54F1
MTDLRYADFAREADGVSPSYAEFSRAVAADGELLALIDTLPERSRQPNLLFGAVRLLGGPVSSWQAFRSFTLARWDAVAPEMRGRITQTNEAGRCAALLPLLASLPQPLALLEVGASAGLCLYPDRYAYRYGGQTVGSGVPLLDCDFVGEMSFLPTRLPEVVWRAGIDLNPLDVRSASDLAWLEALIWPEQEHRRARLRAAASIVAADPPLLVRGDLVEELPALAASAPADATLVVFHTSVLYLVPEARRQAFVSVVRSLPGHWISNEASHVLPFPGMPEPPAAHNVLALDGRPVAWTRGHGQALTVFPR